jgi:DNA repair exonuclease SbcCD nuclease subunit
MTTKNLRLIQTGDWHLFANHSTWAPSGFRHRETRLKHCLRKMFEESRNADFLVLTGDLIDLRSVGTSDERLAWLDGELGSLNKEKVIVTYGSHDDKSIREWFASRTAHRKQLVSNVYSVEYPSHDIIFYAVDSDFEDSRNQGLKMKDATRVILEARKNKHSNFSRAVLLTQLSEKDGAQIQSLRECIDYSALGDHHFGRLLMDRKPYSAYSGAPVARDACTDGDSGRRWFIEVKMDCDGRPVAGKVSLPAGGCQVKVKGGSEAITLVNGPGTENKYVMKIQEPQDLPKRIVDRINEITDNQWTSVALADSVPHQKDILYYIERRYGASTHSSFCTPTRNGAMYYYVRWE